MLSIYPNARGFAYALFEGVVDPIDWGAKRQSNRKPSVYLARVSELLDVFEPRVLVLRDCHDKHARCSKRTKTILTRIETQAREKALKHLGALVFETLEAMIDAILRVAAIATERLMADRVETQQLCVDDVCVTEAEFAAVFGTDRTADPMPTASSTSAKSDGKDDGANATSTTPAATKRMIRLRP